MDSTTTLATVMQHAQSQRDQALGSVRQAESAASAAREQATQLQTYRGEYRERWTTRFQQSGTVELLNCYHGFAGRLDQAISMQLQTAHQAERRLQQAQALLLTRELRVAAVTKLMERRHAEQLRSQGRREQRQLDESAARQALGSRRHSTAA